MTTKKNGNRSPRAVAWCEITGKDGDALRSFYSRLFGWETADGAPGANYGVMDAAPQGIGAGLGKSQRGPGHVTVFIEVDDLEATLREAESLGGKTIAGPITFPDKRPLSRGRGSVTFAYFADPEGHVVGLWKSIVRA